MCKKVGIERQKDQANESKNENYENARRQMYRATV